MPQDPNIARIVQEFEQRAQLMCDLLSDNKETSNSDEILIDEQRRYLWAYWGALAHALLFSPVEENRVIDRALKLKGRAEALFHRRLPAFQLTVKVLRSQARAITHTHNNHAHTQTSARNRTHKQRYISHKNTHTSHLYARDLRAWQFSDRLEDSGGGFENIYVVPSRYGILRMCHTATPAISELAYRL